MGNDFLGPVETLSGVVTSSSLHRGREQFNLNHHNSYETGSGSNGGGGVGDKYVTLVVRVTESALRERHGLSECKSLISELLKHSGFSPRIDQRCQLEDLLEKIEMQQSFENMSSPFSAVFAPYLNAFMQPFESLQQHDTNQLFDDVMSLVADSSSACAVSKVRACDGRQHKPPQSVDTRQQQAWNTGGTAVQQRPSVEDSCYTQTYSMFGNDDVFKPPVESNLAKFGLNIDTSLFSQPPQMPSTQSTPGRIAQPTDFTMTAPQQIHSVGPGFRYSDQQERSFDEQGKVEQACRSLIGQLENNDVINPTTYDWVNGGSTKSSAVWMSTATPTATLQSATYPTACNGDWAFFGDRVDELGQRSQRSKSLASDDSSGDSRASCSKNCIPLSRIEPGMKNVPQWLKYLRLHKYQNLFATLTFDRMMGLTENDLIDQGVTKGARNKILISLHKLKQRSEILIQFLQDLDNLGNMSKCEQAGVARKIVSELKLIILTPLRRYQPTGTESDVTIDGLNCNVEVVSKENIPALFTRVLQRLMNVLVSGLVIEDQCYQTLMSVFDFTADTDFFTDPQLVEMVKLRQKLAKIWRPARRQNNTGMRYWTPPTGRPLKQGGHGNVPQQKRWNSQSNSHDVFSNMRNPLDYSDVSTSVQRTYSLPADTPAPHQHASGARPILGHRSTYAAAVVNHAVKPEPSTSTTCEINPPQPTATTYNPLQPYETNGWSVEELRIENLCLGLFNLGVDVGSTVIRRNDDVTTRNGQLELISKIHNLNGN